MADAVRTTRWERGSPTGRGADRLVAEAAVRHVVGPAVDRLVATGTLTEDQAAAVRREVDVELGEEAPGRPPATPPAGTPAPASAGPLPPGAGAAPAGSPWAPVLAEVGGYVGGAFVFGAAAVLVGAGWRDLPTFARLAVLAVPAVLLLIAAVVVSRSTPGRRDRRAPGPRRRSMATFVAAAAAMLGATAGVAADAAGGSDEVRLLAAFWTMLAVSAAGYAVCRGGLLHLASGVAVVGAVLATQAALGGWDGRRTGWALVTIGVAWALATLAGVLAERELGSAWSGVLGFLGGQTLVGSGTAFTGYAVLLALAAVGLAGFVVLRVLALLVAGVVTLAVVVPQAVIDVSDGTLGAAGALLVVGLSIVGASVLGFRLHRTPPLG